LINAGGALSCGPPSSVSANPIDIAINGSLAYVDDVVNGEIYLCPVGTLGALMPCTVPTGSTTFSAPIQIAIH
jgi:hypothetical protein